jgi:hypothetical protein
MPAINGTNILLALRDKHASDWLSLCEFFQVDPDLGHHFTLHIKLKDQLLDLRKLKLVYFEDDGSKPGEIAGKIKVTDQWNRIHFAIGGPRLADLSVLTEGGMVVQPWHRKPEGKDNAAEIFVAMPFKKKLDHVYKPHMVNVAKRLNMSINRADEFFNADDIMKNVWESICAAKIIIADCTGQSANVFYEMGLAHAIGKPVLLITKNHRDIPFDIHHIRYLHYQNTDKGLKIFEEELEKTIISIQT